MKILFRVLMGIAAFIGYTTMLSAIDPDTGTGSDPQELIEFIAITTGADAPAFTASLTGSVATMSSSLAASTQGTRDNGISISEAHFEIGLVSNDSDGFVVQLKSDNDGNFRETASTAGDCTDENGAGEGAQADSDSVCITYDIECNDIVHDETNGATLTTLFFGADGQTGEWMHLTGTNVAAYTTIDTGVYPGFANYPAAEAVVDGVSLTPLYCDLRFSTNEDANEIGDGTYADTITITYTGN